MLMIRFSPMRDCFVAGARVAIGQERERQSGVGIGEADLAGGPTVTEGAGPVAVGRKPWDRPSSPAKR